MAQNRRNNKQWKQKTPKQQPKCSYEHFLYNINLKSWYSIKLLSVLHFDCSVLTKTYTIYYIRVCCYSDVVRFSVKREKRNQEAITDTACRRKSDNYMTKIDKKKNKKIKKPTQPHKKGIMSGTPEVPAPLSLSWKSLKKFPCMRKRQVASGEHLALCASGEHISKVTIENNRFII